MGIVSRGFEGRRSDADPSRLPPGQYATDDFPVLSIGPTPHRGTESWSFEIGGAVGTERGWNWDEFLEMPSETFTVDIHCVTRWTKFDTSWRGVPVDRVLEGVEPRGQFVVAWSDDGYTTNVPLADLTGGKAWVAYEYGGEPIAPEHGGPARLLVPHLYLWKSAKWVRGLKVVEHDSPGFWERNGYHNYGDPWKEQRYWND